MIIINRVKISEHFYLNEFECPCCHRVMLDEKLLPMLEKLRKLWGNPIIITSGYRCEKHNLAVGGVSGSQHTLGKAVDIAVKPDEINEVVSLAQRVGFTAIGVYKGKEFVHLDIRAVSNPVIWSGGGLDG